MRNMCSPDNYKHYSSNQLSIMENNKDAAAVTSLALLALQTAIGQLGQCEEPKGSNKGVMVNQYLKAVGLNPGYSWCQAFVYWCYDQAAQRLGMHNPVVRTAGVLNCWNNTAVNFKIAPADALRHPGVIKPGAQFILDYGHGVGHTGMIERVEGTTLYTIEGNSNNDGSREGYLVVRHQRSLTAPLLKGIIVY